MDLEAAYETHSNTSRLVGKLDKESHKMPMLTLLIFTAPTPGLLLISWTNHFLTPAIKPRGYRIPYNDPAKLHELARHLYPYPYTAILTYGLKFTCFILTILRDFLHICYGRASNHGTWYPQYVPCPPSSSPQISTWADRERVAGSELEIAHVAIERIMPNNYTRHIVTSITSCYATQTDSE